MLLRILLVASAAITATACADDRASEPGLIDVLVDMEGLYTAPIERQSPDVLCDYVDPASREPGCSRLIAALARHNKYLDWTIERVRALHAVSKPNEAGDLLAQAISALELADQSDEALVESWQSADPEGWRSAWALHEQAANAWIAFVENVRRFAASDSS